MDEYQEYKGQILGENDNGETEKLKADSITESLKTISTDHSAIHNKQGFSISGIFGAVADSLSVNYAFRTPTFESGKIIHYKINDIQSTTNNKVRVDFYEVPIAPASGSDVVAYNHYRVGEVVESAMQAIKFNATLDMSDAVMLDYHYLSNHLQSMEWVLKPNQWYVRIISNLSGGAIDVSFYDFWIEED